MTAPADLTTRSSRTRVDDVDWPTVVLDLDDVGVALTGPLLDTDECRALVGLFDDDVLFRSTVDMAQHRFGEGRYRYFADPIPDAVRELRAALWPHLLGVARTWARRRDEPTPWPDEFDDWITDCHAAGQTRPTPLMLRYEAGDWNACTATCTATSCSRCRS